MKKGIITIFLSIVLSSLAAVGIVKAASPSPEMPVGANAGAAGNADNPSCPVTLSVPDYPDFTYAAENSVKAVVYVKVSVRHQSRSQMIDPLFRFFFGDEDMRQPGPDRLVEGSGSGVIIREDGYIVTNNHVVENAVKVEVMLNDNKTYEATVVGTDPATDVALIKIDASGLPCLGFADSDKLRLGEWVLAIGSPLELRSTITAGIVSAKGRSMPNYDGKFRIESFIQTDAAVNPGNSGGALVNKAGELVGINTAIISQTGSYSGYSFAIPSNIVAKVVSDIIDFGTVRRVKLGVVISPVDEKTAEQMKLSSLDGVYIVEVMKGSAADKAGLKAGDVILAVDSIPVNTTTSLLERVNGYHPGDSARLAVVRGSRQMEIDVVFQDSEQDNGAKTSDGSVSFYGAMLRKADADRLKALGLKWGVEIVSAGDGKMALAGAQEGQIIQYVNDVAVKSPEDVVSVAKKSQRAVYVEGVGANGRAVYFGFGKE